MSQLNLSIFVAEAATINATVHAPKLESHIQTKQLGLTLGVSRTLPKLGHSVPTPPLSNKPRRGRRRQERSMDPPYEFR